MSEVFFEQLQLPVPDEYLGIGGGSHTEQTARMMLAFEPVLRARNPDVVVVVGDVNSTLAATLVAVKLNIPVLHVEAGLRSGDRTMPEELNRIATDALASRLYASEASGVEHLRNEGVAEEDIVLAGNVMIDSLERFRRQAVRPNLSTFPYVLMTMHRPATVDLKDPLQQLVAVVEHLADQTSIVFPIHPRTKRRLDEFGFLPRLQALEGLSLTGPVGYLEFLGLMAHASVVVTDSGGIQEETTALGVPCITLRPHTERPATVEIGTNVLLPLNPNTVADHVMLALSGRWKQGSLPPLWDGRAAERIADDLVKHYGQS